MGLCGVSGRERACDDGGSEGAGLVASVAERFVLGSTAAAERDDRSSGEVEDVAVLILEDEVAFDAQGGVVLDGDHGGHGRIVADGAGRCDGAG